MVRDDRLRRTAAHRSSWRGACRLLDVRRMTYIVRSNAEPSWGSRSTLRSHEKLADAGARRAVRPMNRSLTGTLRQPRGRHASPRAMSSTSRSMMRWPARSHARGRKNMPTPYCPASGTAMWAFAHVVRRNACGSCSSMPDPSLDAASLPTALRCSRFSKAVARAYDLARSRTAQIARTHAAPIVFMDRSYSPCTAGSPARLRADFCHTS